MYHSISRAYLSRQSMLRKSLLNEQTNRGYVLAPLRTKPVGTVISVTVEFMDLAKYWINELSPMTLILILKEQLGLPSNLNIWFYSNSCAQF